MRVANDSKWRCIRALLQRFEASTTASTRSAFIASHAETARKSSVHVQANVCYMYFCVAGQQLHGWRPFFEPLLAAVTASYFSVHFCPLAQRYCLLKCLRHHLVAKKCEECTRVEVFAAVCVSRTIR